MLCIALMSLGHACRSRTLALDKHRSSCHRLRRCMATRHTAPRDPLWRSAAAAFQTCMSAGVPATNIAYVSKAPPTGIWEALAVALEGFFLAEASLMCRTPDATTSDFIATVQGSTNQ